MLSIGVFGSSRPVEGSPAYEDAREIGREVGRRGGRVVCGGYGGVMEAACRGAAEGGGTSLGVLIEGRGEGNAWLTQRRREPDLAARLRGLRDESQGWIFLPRGLGTMLEIVWMAESVVKGDVEARPFIFLGDFWRATVDTGLGEASNSSGAAALRACLRWAGTPSEAVDLAMASTVRGLS